MSQDFSPQAEVQPDLSVSKLSTNSPKLELQRAAAALNLSTRLTSILEKLDIKLTLEDSFELDDTSRKDYLVHEYENFTLFTPRYIGNPEIRVVLEKNNGKIVSSDSAEQAITDRISPISKRSGKDQLAVFDSIDAAKAWLAESASLEKSPPFSDKLSSVHTLNFDSLEWTSLGRSLYFGNDNVIRYHGGLEALDGLKFLSDDELEFYDAYRDQNKAKAFIDKYFETQMVSYDGREVLCLVEKESKNRGYFNLIETGDFRENVLPRESSRNLNCVTEIFEQFPALIDEVRREAGSALELLTVSDNNWLRLNPANSDVVMIGKGHAEKETFVGSFSRADLVSFYMADNSDPDAIGFRKALIGLDGNSEFGRSANVKQNGSLLHEISENGAHLFMHDAWNFNAELPKGSSLSAIVSIWGWNQNKPELYSFKISRDLDGKIHFEPYEPNAKAILLGDQSHYPRFALLKLEPETATAAV